MTGRPLIASAGPSKVAMAVQKPKRVEQHKDSYCNSMISYCNSKGIFMLDIRKTSRGDYLELSGRPIIW